jgi:hypothetical protein
VRIECALADQGVVCSSNPKTEALRTLSIPVYAVLVANRGKAYLPPKE